jgi:hypothetical protein
MKRSDLKEKKTIGIWRDDNAGRRSSPRRTRVVVTLFHPHPSDRFVIFAVDKI